MESEDFALESKTYFKRLAAEFDDSALQFAKLCLLQPDSILVPDERRITIRPDGYNDGPECFADRESLEYDNIADVLPLVAYWCRLNTIRLDISFFEESYCCTLTEASPVRQVFMSESSANLCYCLLSACAGIAAHMKDVLSPQASIRSGE